MPSAGRAQTLLKDIGFALIVFLVLLLLAEMVLRVAPGFADPGMASGLRMCEAHPTRIWQYRAGVTQRHRTKEFAVEVHTNSWRLRGPEVEAGEDALRVLVIGDSFTFGWGVEERERYSEVLQELLRTRPGHKVHVTNAGYWGYTFDQQYLLLRELVPRLRPHVVIQGVHPGHVPTLQGHRLEFAPSGELVAVRNDAITVDERGAVRFRNDWLDRPPLGSRVLGTAARAFLNWRLSRSQLTRELALYDPRSTLFEREWALSRDLFHQTGRYLQVQGVPWIVALIPRDFQVGKEEWNAAEPKTAGLDLELPTRRVADILAETGARVVDLLPAFRQHYTAELYFKTDPHWAAAGHALAARSIRAVVEETLLDPAPGEPGSPARFQGGP